MKAFFFFECAASNAESCCSCGAALAKRKVEQWTWYLKLNLFFRRDLCLTEARHLPWLDLLLMKNYIELFLFWELVESPLVIPNVSGVSATRNSRWKNDVQMVEKPRGDAYSFGKRRTLPRSQDEKKKSNEENLFPRTLWSLTFVICQGSNLIFFTAYESSWLKALTVVVCEIIQICFYQDERLLRSSFSIRLSLFWCADAIVKCIFDKSRERKVLKKLFLEWIYVFHQDIKESFAYVFSKFLSVAMRSGFLKRSRRCRWFLWIK